MIGHFENGVWHEESPRFIPLCISLKSELPCAIQVERVAKLLKLKPLTGDMLNGEIIICGTKDHWYRVLDFIEKTLERVK